MSVDPAMTRTIPCMVSTFAPSVLIPNMQPLHVPEINLTSILYKVVTPYISTVWSRALVNVNLTDSYPNLVHDLSFGSPIGNPPPIDFTFIPNNLHSAKIQPDILQISLMKKSLLATWMGLFLFVKLILFMEVISRHVPLAWLRSQDLWILG